jgi:hypothetical protein
MRAIEPVRKFPAIRRSLYESQNATITFFRHRLNSLSGRHITKSAAGVCPGIFPCDGINYGNQQGDYEGLVSFGGVSYPVWTDSRRQLDASSGCRRPFLMEEVFTAKVK